MATVTSRNEYDDCFNQCFAHNPRRLMRADRLLKLAAHLETGKLGHDRFSFDNFHVAGLCNSVGCAMGEMPTLWPDKITFDSQGYNLKFIGRSYLGEEVVKMWFQISDMAEIHLFYPFQQRPSRYGGRVLTGTATRQQVAANIRAFVKKCQPTKNPKEKSK